MLTASFLFDFGIMIRLVVKTRVALPHFSCSLVKNSVHLLNVCAISNNWSGNTCGGGTLFIHSHWSYGSISASHITAPAKSPGLRLVGFRTYIIISRCSEVRLQLLLTLTPAPMPRPFTMLWKGSVSVSTLQHSCIDGCSNISRWFPPHSWAFKFVLSCSPGSDKEAILDLITSRNNAQRQEVIAAYKNNFGKVKLFCILFPQMLVVTLNN